jgi:hypothetical protein
MVSVEHTIWIRHTWSNISTLSIVYARESQPPSRLPAFVSLVNGYPKHRWLTFKMMEAMSPDDRAYLFEMYQRPGYGVYHHPEASNRLQSHKEFVAMAFLAETFPKSHISSQPTLTVRMTRTTKSLQITIAVGRWA